MRREWRLVRPTLPLVVAAVVAGALVVGFVVVAVVNQVPPDSPIGRPSWPGLGFVGLVAIGLVGLASLVDALRSGRARRSALRRPEADEPAPPGRDEPRS